jgi:hypothetical protein
MTTITKEVEVDVDLDDFDDYELLQELDTRGIIANQNYRDQITKIWELRRSGQSYQQALDELIYDTIGRLV